MFYSQVLLTRKGPLAKIWMAAHFDKKLTRNQIFATDIIKTVNSIINPIEPLSLRVSGHLMLGVARIFNRKMKYLISDCMEAFWKIKLAYKPTSHIDITVQPAPIANLDDVRHFGNIIQDPDFPELDGAAFTQAIRFPSVLSMKSKLPQQTGLETQEQFFDDEALNWFGFQSQAAQRARAIERGRIPAVAEGESETESESASTSQLSATVRRISDIEMTRFGSRIRPSTSSLRIRPSFGFGATGIDLGEGEIPALEEGPESFLSESFGNAPVEMDVVPLSDQLFDTSLPAIQPEVLLPTVGESVQIPSIEAVAEEEQQARKRLRKKHRAKLDERIEITTKKFKERLEGIEAIMRRQPSDPLPSLTAEQLLLNIPVSERLSRPFGYEEMCPDHKFLFNCIMTTGPLPFPKLFPEEAVQMPMELPIEPEMPRAEQQWPESATRKRKSIAFPSAEKTLLSRESESIGGRAFALGVGLTPLLEEYEPFDQPLQQPFEEFAFEASEILADDIGELGRSAILRRSIELASEPELSAFEPEIPSVGVSGGLVSRLPRPQNRATWSQKTATVMEILEKRFTRQEQISFKEISKGAGRRLVATSFMEILQLKTWGMIQLTQSYPFADIVITQSRSE